MIYYINDDFFCKSQSRQLAKKRCKLCRENATNFQTEMKPGRSSYPRARPTMPCSWLGGWGRRSSCRSSYYRPRDHPFPRQQQQQPHQLFCGFLMISLYYIEVRVEKDLFFVYLAYIPTTLANSTASEYSPSIRVQLVYFDFQIQNCRRRYIRNQ